MFKKFRSLLKKDNSKNIKLTKEQKRAQIQEIQSALTEIELRDR